MTTHEAKVRTLFDEVFNQRNFETLDELFEPEFTEHAVAPFAHDPPGRVHGPSHMRGVIEWLVAQHPDLTMHVDAVVSDDDMVVTRVTAAGTNLGAINGTIPPTGERFCSTQSHWYRIVDGRFVEHWAVRDDLSTMLQLGLVAPVTPNGEQS